MHNNFKQESPNMAEVDVSNFEAQLLSPEDEERIAREDSRGNHEYTFSMGTSSIEVVGTPHLYTLDEAKPITEALASDDIDILLIEGTAALKKSAQIEPNADASFVLENWGEQTYAAWLAKQKGVQVESWDIDMLSLLKEAKEHHSDEAILGWIAGIGAKHIIDKGDNLEPQHLIELISSSLGLSSEDFARELGLDLSTTSINEVSQFYIRKDFADLTYDDGEAIATPRKRGETNDVIRGMNLARDRQFLETVARHKSTSNKIVATCGKAHAITWKPALEQMYS